MEAIKLWLDNPQDYRIGVHLYRLFGGNSFQALLFAQAETAFNKKRLIEELSKLLAAAPAASEQKNVPLQAKSKAAKVARASDMADAPPEIKEVVEQRKRLYNESRDCFARMKGSKSKEERFELAKTIRKNFFEINKIWAITNHFDKTGEIKQRVVFEEKLDNMDYVTLNQKFEAHYKYVMKNQKDETKKDKNLERIRLMHLIKEILIKDGAFHFAKYTIPSIT